MALIIGEKNPKLVKSEDIGNLARMNYGKPAAETAIGKVEENPSEEAETETPSEVVIEEETKQSVPKKGGRSRKS